MKGPVLALLVACAASCGAGEAAIPAPRDAAAARLPDGRTVVSAPAGDGAALFVEAGDGSPPRRITWGGNDVDPTVLSDGRVLFSTFRARAGGAGGRFVLATVNPDGTEVTLFHAGRESLRQPRQRPSLDVECEVRPENAATGTRVLLSWDDPATAPVPAGHDPGGVPARPQGHLSVVREDRPFGTIYCVDARRGAPGAVTVRVRTRTNPSGILGAAPLAADGSFHLRVPPDVPFSLEMLDAAGAVVAAEAGPIWVRPNEVRGCVGCHDDPGTAPPNVRPLAVAAAPADFSGAREARR